MSDRSRKHRLAILLSGRGSNFEAIADAIEDGRIPNAEIVAVISDVAGALGPRARAAAWPCRRLRCRARGTRARAGPARAESSEILDRTRPDLVCLAGYMRILSPDFVERFRGRILNVHPSLLPKFPGLEPQRRALEAGETESGCTVHFVDEGTDSGPIVLQRRVPILPGDTAETLAARILDEEHRPTPKRSRACSRSSRRKA